jgi:hypothetical protein
MRIIFFAAMWFFLLNVLWLLRHWEPQGVSTDEMIFCTHNRAYQALPEKQTGSFWAGFSPLRRYTPAQKASQPPDYLRGHSAPQRTYSTEVTGETAAISRFIAQRIWA